MEVTGKMKLMSGNETGCFHLMGQETSVGFALALKKTRRRKMKVNTNIGLLICRAGRMQRIKQLTSHLSSSDITGSVDLFSKNSNDVVITLAVRSPLTKARKGGFKDTRSDELLLSLFKSTIARSGIDPSLIQDITVGTVLPPGAAYEARAAAIAAGIPVTTPVQVVNRFCSSGLMAVTAVANQIRAGQIDIGLAVGVESMSANPDKGSPPLCDEIMAHETAKDCIQPMGWTSENVAEEFNISREDMDKFAALYVVPLETGMSLANSRSFQRAERAQKEGRFNEEIIPLEGYSVDPTTGKRNKVLISKDDGIRYGTTSQTLGKIKPAFPQWGGGKTTGGNASQVTDGAAAVMLMARWKAEELKIPIIAKYITTATSGLAPRIMGIGPVYAIPRLLELTKLSIDDVDLFEINEAFASMYVYCVRKLGLDIEKVNVNGGAIALGHPLDKTNLTPHINTSLSIVLINTSNTRGPSSKQTQILTTPNMSLTPKHSHFNSLPDDIIFQIFYQGIFGGRQNNHASLMPLLYSKVCRKWRALTLEASWLWSLITFCDDYEPYSLTRLYLERSRFAALTIEINVTSVNFDPDDDRFWLTEEDVKGRMALFLPHANRWRSFTCWTDNWAPLFYVVNQLATVELPLLKSLALIQVFPDPEDYPPAPPISPFNTTSIAAPLDRLDLRGVSLDWKHLSGLCLNLTNLSLRELPVSQQPLSVENFYGIIKNASTTLRELSLRGIGAQWDFQRLPITLQSVFLPNIEQFSFRPDDGGDTRCDLACLAKLLTLFEFGLKLFSVSLTRFFEDPNFDQFIPVLSSKFCRIKNLSIGHMSMTDIQFAQWLNVLPHLTSLSIVGQDFQTVAFQALKLQSEYFGNFTTPILCPLLRSLTPHSPYDGMVYLVVAARLKAGKPLRSITWKAHHRKAVESLTNYPYLKANVEMIYEGPNTKSNRLWVGPPGAYDNIVLDNWNHLIVGDV
ncbi:hypothetical protein Clacol_004078 [Clathrus columnatus]|uniref:Uncharacterized protein n=1 Tax=Clathrus columnatus TaxID=1419009 RepID=A0AAV5A5G2_9AGAM|nr:hypothetical protein Clacol_004078 [Clathrus columnatus]